MNRKILPVCAARLRLFLNKDYTFQTLRFSSDNAPIPDSFIPPYEERVDEPVEKKRSR